MRDDPVVVALVARAVEHDQNAWNELVERYSPLVWAICTRYRLNRHDIEDVNQNVWLRLVEQLGKLREPAALPGWLATTTSRECLRVARAGHRWDHFSATLDELPPSPDEAIVEEEVIAAEQNAALRAALAELPPNCQQLLAMFISATPHSYAEISAILQIPVGSIGPQRARCLARLRRSSSFRGLMEHENEDPALDCPGGEPHA
jgi:RNA polymerase sigma factor (sigma-70 family)